MNHRHFLLLILGACPVLAFGQQTPLAPSARLVLDSAFTIVRRHALWRDTVTWAVVEPRVRAIAAGAETASDVYPAIRALLTSLGDHHSFHMRPSGTRQFQTGGAQNPRPDIRALPDSIGYISVPAYAGADPAAARSYVTDVYTALRAALPQTRCRWVVDLRSNGGGNMWPMLAGLRPLLGEAGLGSFVSATGPGPLWRARCREPSPRAGLGAPRLRTRRGTHRPPNGKFG